MPPPPGEISENGTSKCCFVHDYRKMVKTVDGAFVLINLIKGSQVPHLGNILKSNHSQIIQASIQNLHVHKILLKN